MVSGTERANWQQQATALTAADLLKFGTTAVIAPHPDDESLGCGGTIALLRQSGLPVYVIFVSDGSMSHPNSKKYPAEALRKLRESEALQALQLLNVPAENASFMHLKDTAVPDESTANFDVAVQLMRAELHRIQPETILVTWEKDNHHDHRSSWQILNKALTALDEKPRVLQYLIWIWELGKQTDVADNQQTKWFKVDIKAVADLKKQAIAAHASQVSRLIDDDPEGFILSPEILAHFDYADELFIETI